MEETLIMAPPPPWASICFPAHLQPKKTPLTLIWITVFQPLALMSSTLARKEAPALLTMMSTRPMSFAVRSTSALTASSWRTSTASQKERRPSFLISSTTGSRFSFLRLQITTSAPALATSTAMEWPIPTPPPVTMATFFSSENGDAAMMPPVRGSPSPLRGEGRVRGSSKPRGLYPSLGRRAVEAHGLARGRMDEAQAPRVKAKPPERPRRAAVLAIAHDRMSDRGELDPDLPASPRAERELEKRRVLPMPDHPVARDGRLAFGAGCGVDAQALVLHEPALEGAGIPPDLSSHERDIGPLDGTRLELGLKVSLRGFRFGEDEKPRRLAVEAMDDEGARARTLRGEVVPEQAIGGALALPLRGHAEEPRLLVDHHHGRVLVNEAQAAREGDAAARAEDDAVLGPDHDAAVAADAAVELDSPGLEPLFETSTGCLREEGAEHRRERGRFTHCGARPTASCREA